MLKIEYQKDQMRDDLAAIATDLEEINRNNRSPILGRRRSASKVVQKRIINSHWIWMETHYSSKV